VTVASKKDKPDKGSGHPWRDNIEAITMAIIVAVMLKYFVVEAYKIPTGSMQPTLLGHKPTGIFDRIIVDKLSYHYRDPMRWEVVVFKYPLDRSKNFIKRLVGMPGEQLRIHLGDLWTRPDDASEWTVLRRPKPVQREVWKRIDPADPRYAAWRAETAAGWTIDGRHTVHARGDGSVLLPSDRGSVVDSYSDGYPGVLGSKLTKQFQPNEVGDLRLTGSVEALAGCRAVQLELREGDSRYLFELPGPAAPEDARPGILVESLRPTATEPIAHVRTDAPRRLATGRGVDFAVQNMDDRLTFEIDGEEVLALDVAPAVDQSSWFQLHCIGEGADFTDLEVYRDIYYLDYGEGQWTIPEGSYFMLGDNTQDSSDSRLWVLQSWRLPGSEGDGVVRANFIESFDPNQRHPVAVTGDPIRGTMIWLRDEWGELHVFPQASAERLGFENASFVPRNLITGRAVMVFWPYAPSLGVWRLKWIH
jgi:signal peptidase I